jgi:hypothetical protein
LQRLEVMGLIGMRQEKKKKVMMEVMKTGSFMEGREDKYS